MGTKNNAIDYAFFNALICIYKQLMIVGLLQKVTLIFTTNVYDNNMKMWGASSSKHNFYFKHGSCINYWNSKHEIWLYVLRYR